jgi:hypothetical protein
VAVATRVPNTTATAVSPEAATVTVPSSLTAATVSSVLVNRAHRVTSAVLPSEYAARTTTRRVSFGLSRAAGGNTSILASVGSLASGPGAPAATQSRSRA